MRCLIIILFLINSITGLAQGCNMPAAKYKPKPSQGIKYSASYGLCYHYNSTTIETGYKNHFVSVTSMYRNILRSTPRMQDEIYIGYTYNQPLNKRLNIGASTFLRVSQVRPVYRFFIDYKILGPIYVHGSTVQVHNGMNHLIAGLKLIL